MQVVVDEARKKREELLRQQQSQQIKPAPKMEIVEKPIVQQIAPVQQVQAPPPYDPNKRQRDIDEMIEMRKLEMLGITNKPAPTTSTPTTAQGRKLEIVKVAEDLKAELEAINQVRNLIQPEKNPVESIMNTEFGKGLGMMVSQFGMGLIQDFQQMRRLKFEEQRLKMLASQGQLPQQPQQQAPQQPQSQPEAAQQYQQAQQQQGPQLKLDDADKALIAANYGAGQSASTQNLTELRF